MAARRRTAARKPAEPDTDPRLEAPAPPAPRDAPLPSARRERQQLPPGLTVADLDKLLDGLFGWPVELQDMYDATDLVKKMWPDAIVETKHYHGREVHITVWFGEAKFACNAAVYRVLRAP